MVLDASLGLALLHASGAKRPLVIIVDVRDSLVATTSTLRNVPGIDIEDD
jgi:hypothetical protein